MRQRLGAAAALLRRARPGAGRGGPDRPLRSWLPAATAVALLALAVAPAFVGAWSKVSRSGNTLRVTSGPRPSKVLMGADLYGQEIKDLRGRILVGHGCEHSGGPRRAYCGNLYDVRKLITSLGGGADVSYISHNSRYVNARGGAGPDQFNGGSLADEIFGGAGSDWLYGSDGNDHLNGGRGRDTIYCGGGFDVAVLSRGDVTDGECERRR
ncbi:MAG: hypothetical protein ACXWZM_04260 [Solirubrobacterales bacterium]